MRTALLRTIASVALGTTLVWGAPQRAYTERATGHPTAGDFAEGEDPEFRRAAVEAMGAWNGALVAVDADTGRVLTMVNQKLALASGAIPCSTIKLVAGAAALSEGLLAPGEKVWFPGGWFMTLVEGLAISNNVLFDHLGERLGFERFRRYARLFGFGERAGWSIPGEHVGEFPDREHPAGVGRMTSFGDGIAVTPLQLAAFTAALANGGNLYYLQHPTGAEAAGALDPKLKRRLPIEPLLPELEAGMAAAVGRGTGRNARSPGLAVRGKTGTCSEYWRRGGVRMGWFASFDRDVAGRKLAVVVMLRGNTVTSGPLAAEIAGKFYRAAGAERYSRAAGECDCD